MSWSYAITYLNVESVLSILDQEFGNKLVFLPTNQWSTVVRVTVSASPQCAWNLDWAKNEKKVEVSWVELSWGEVSTYHAVENRHELLRDHNAVLSTDQYWAIGTWSGGGGGFRQQRQEQQQDNVDQRKSITPQHTSCKHINGVISTWHWSTHWHFDDTITY